MWSFKKICNEFRSYRKTIKRVHSGEVQEDPRQGGESAKGPVEKGQG